MVVLCPIKPCSRINVYVLNDTSHKLALTLFEKHGNMGQIVNNYNQNPANLP